MVLDSRREDKDVLIYPCIKVLISWFSLTGCQVPTKVTPTPQLDRGKKLWWKVC